MLAANPLRPKTRFDARAQGARWLEMLALTELCDSDTASDDDRDALGMLLTQLSQGIDAPVLVKARALLERAHSS